MQATKKTPQYGFTKTVEAEFDEVIERTRQELSEEGFGVLTEIRIDEKLKEKLGADFRRYVILGACNPELAYETLKEDINIGLLLPCNVVVYESETPGQSVVATIDASKMMSVVGDMPAITETANEVTSLLRKALARI